MIAREPAAGIDRARDAVVAERVIRIEHAPTLTWIASCHRAPAALAERVVRHGPASAGHVAAALDRAVDAVVDARSRRPGRAEAAVAHLDPVAHETVVALVVRRALHRRAVWGAAVRVAGVRVAAIHAPRAAVAVTVGLRRRNPDREAARTRRAPRREQPRRSRPHIHATPRKHSSRPRRWLPGVRPRSWLWSKPISGL